MIPRRIKHEMKSWPDGWQVFPNDELVFIIIDDLDVESIVLTIDFKKAPSYPFRPPHVLCNNEDLISLYAKMFSIDNELQNDMINLSKKQCWCCDTLLCKNNWSVGNKITDIVDEFKFLYKIKKRAIERKWAKIISRECLIEDIPIFSFL